MVRLLWLLLLCCTIASAHFCCKSYSISYVYVPPQTVGYYRIPIYQHLRGPPSESSYYTMQQPLIYPTIVSAHSYFPLSKYAPYECRPDSPTFDHNFPPRAYNRKPPRQHSFIHRPDVTRELFKNEISMNEIRSSTFTDDDVDDFLPPIANRLRQD